MLGLYNLSENKSRGSPRKPLGQTGDNYKKGIDIWICGWQHTEIKKLLKAQKNPTYPQEFRPYVNTETGPSLENSESKKLDGASKRQSKDSEDSS